MSKKSKEVYRVMTLVPISFDADDKQVVIPQGSYITVDVKEKVGYFEGLHFAIDRTEYSMMC